MTGLNKVFVIVILFCLQVEFSNTFLFLFKKKKNNASYDPFSFHRQSDEFGQFEFRNGRKTYLYCYDVRCDPKLDCRPGHSDVVNYQNNHYRGENNHFHHHHYHHGGSGGWNSFVGNEDTNYNNYDGRDNIRVGTGRFYPRDYGRTIEVECIFPSGSTLISSIKWFRKSFGRSRRRNRGYYPGRSSNDKYQIQSMGPNGSTLTIRDYNSFEDDGVYRCFAMRSSRYGSGRPESVYVETDVTYRGGYQGGCGGGFSACG